MGRMPDKQSQRTKNRLKEHKNLKEIGRSESVQAFNGRPGIYFRCEDDGCKWWGWLPQEEIE
jgi:hypothetical protein